MSNTRKIQWKGWKKENPGAHERTIMHKKCGKKCFLGPNNTFPICKKHTCTVSKKGVYAAYIRSRQFRNKSSKYRTIAAKSKKLLYKKDKK